VSPVELTDGREGGEGLEEEPNHMTGKKGWSSIKQSILSGGEDSWHQRDIMAPMVQFE
jgi:hypothetical protein